MYSVSNAKKPLVQVPTHKERTPTLATVAPQSNVASLSMESHSSLSP
jgi:hypothetical protein